MAMGGGGALHHLQSGPRSPCRAPALSLQCPGTCVATALPHGAPTESISPGPVLAGSVSPVQRERHPASMGVACTWAIVNQAPSVSTEASASDFGGRPKWGEGKANTRLYAGRSTVHAEPPEPL